MIFPPLIHPPSIKSRESMLQASASSLPQHSFFHFFHVGKGGTTKMNLFDATVGYSTEIIMKKKLKNQWLSGRHFFVSACFLRLQNGSSSGQTSRWMRLRIGVTISIYIYIYIYDVYMSCIYICVCTIYASRKLTWQ